MNNRQLQSLAGRTALLFATCKDYDIANVWFESLVQIYMRLVRQ
jgi:hypothetical protein